MRYADLLPTAYCLLPTALSPSRFDCDFRSGDVASAGSTSEVKRGLAGKRQSIFPLWWTDP